MPRKKLKGKRPKKYRKPVVFRGRDPLARPYGKIELNVRREVRKRDKGKCQFPGCKKCGTQQHHIFPYATHIGWRNVVTNIICLCKAHHEQVKGHELEYALMFVNVIARNTNG